MEINKLEYRKNIRLKNYDYKANGYYFVTICAYNRQPLFVVAPSNGANKAAQSDTTAASADKSLKTTVEGKLNQIGKYYKGVDLDFYVIMPSHVHFILILEDAQVSLSKIVNAFKSWVTRDVKKYLASQGDATTKYVWQPNYYEHVIRNEKALAKIREYIQNNPEAEKLNWDDLEKL